MRLHTDKESFKTIIEATSMHYALQGFQIEKDYYVSLFLSEIAKRAIDMVVFKGGTSLSKSFEVIDRFSEDIDLAVRFNSKLKVTASERKKMKTLIVDIAKDLDMEIINLEETRSRRDFNAYKIKYNNLFSSQADMLDYIVVETIVAYRPYPYKLLPVANYVTKYLAYEKEFELIEKFNLKSFLMNVQSVERTFIDKLFAIADYHLNNDYFRHSRHLYDIHMIWEKKILNFEIIKEILPDIIRDRQLNGIQNVSCMPGTKIVEQIHKIISTKVYESDFKDITMKFIYKSVSYQDCILSLKEILKQNILPETIKDYS